MAAAAKRTAGVILLGLGFVCLIAVILVVDQLLSTSFVRGGGFSLNTMIMVVLMTAGVLCIVFGLFLFRGARRG